MTQEEAFKTLETKIGEIIERMNRLEQENASLRKELADKNTSLNTVRNQVKIAADELESEITKLKAFRKTIEEYEGS